VLQERLCVKRRVVLSIDEVLMFSSWQTAALTLVTIVTLGGCGSQGVPVGGSGSISSSASSPPTVSSPPSVPQYTDPYGFTCAIAQAQPYGLCPTDHNERTGVPSFKDSSGVQCAFDVVDPSTGLCTLSQAAQTAPDTPCTLYVVGHDARLTIIGPNASPECMTFLGNAPSDATWTSEAQMPTGSLSQVCELTSGSNEVTVSDSGSRDYGQEACNALSGEGWKGSTTSSTNTSTTVNCPSGFQVSDGNCVDERHLPCPPGYSGWQNSQLDNCIENPTP
jgi:hypothetical protein